MKSLLYAIRTVCWSAVPYHKRPVVLVHSWAENACVRVVARRCRPGARYPLQTPVVALVTPVWDPHGIGFGFMIANWIEWKTRRIARVRKWRRS